MKTNRILILTAGYGEGHNSAARALQTAFNERPDTQVELVDLFALQAPTLNHLTRHAYLRVINHAPEIWNGFYGWLDRSRYVPLLMRLLRGHTWRLAGLMARYRPTAIVSTYPVYAWLLKQVREVHGFDCPHYTVVTDALTINSLWYRVPSDGWFVTDRDSADLLCAAGISAHQVTATGFPVAPGFADRPAMLQPPDLATGHPPRILFMVNCGRRRALATASALLAEKNWQVTITAGRDEELLRQLQIMAAPHGPRVRLLGWTNRIPHLLMTHHVVISKAGGATTQESINALCPMLVNQIVPGQEAGNYELLRRHDAGTHATTPTATVQTLHRAFVDRGALWQYWRANLNRLARPNAARDIAAHVLTQTISQKAG